MIELVLILFLKIYFSKKLQINKVRFCTFNWMICKITLILLKMLPFCIEFLQILIDIFLCFNKYVMKLCLSLVKILKKMISHLRIFLWIKGSLILNKINSQIIYLPNYKEITNCSLFMVKIIKKAYWKWEILGAIKLAAFLQLKVLLLVLLI